MIPAQSVQPVAYSAANGQKKFQHFLTNANISKAGVNKKSYNLGIVYSAIPNHTTLVINVNIRLHQLIQTFSVTGKR